MSKYHVYREDGFVSAHKSLTAAKVAARRTSKKSGDVRVYRASVFGYTGGKHGSCVARFVYGDAKGCSR